ncbi:hypothetical protein M8C21_029289 [Ambrosia artemisiifolia]|uniref:Uncharacterized protein n=1 Tax=Ambrosia artemisiifolia TaxID=4212 RepID=A0AAD5CHS7_AMBAR|nr:hypothetical protein M8C21_029289 [Ambrosia artemisiifolia]
MVSIWSTFRSVFAFHSIYCRQFFFIQESRDSISTGQVSEEQHSMAHIHWNDHMNPMWFDMVVIQVVGDGSWLLVLEGFTLVVVYVAMRKDIYSETETKQVSTVQINIKRTNDIGFKFKVRYSKYLYTLCVHDKEKADKLKQILHLGLYASILFSI